MNNLSQDGPLREAAFEECAEELYEMAPCGYLTTNLSGRIVKVNRTLLDWLGYNREELTGGKRLTDLLTVGGRIFFETHINLLMRVQEAVNEIALDLIGKDGRTLPVLMNGRQKRDEAGQPQVNRFVIFNATERRMYERDLLATRDLLRVTITSIGDGVIATDAEGRINFLNPVAEQLTGWSNDEARGKPVDEVLVLIRESDSAAVESPIMHALRTAATVGMASDTLLVSRGGVRIPVDDSASPIRDTNGTVIGGVMVFHDISERKKNEALEREQQERLRETVRLEGLGRMAGGIAHDFNNLLTGILGNANLLADTVVSADAPMVKDILHSAERAVSLTRQLLAYSGGGWLDKRSLNLNSLAREGAALLRASLSVQIECDAGPADLMVDADPGHLQQIINNLVMNASEALPEGKGTITINTGVVVRTSSRFSPVMDYTVSAGTYAVLEVGDNGTGISVEPPTKIFDPFFTTKFMGRGLGLSAVLGMVKAHRGDIEVSTEPGNGSTFRILLPALQPPLTVPVPAEVPPQRAASKIHTILIVDDEPVIRKLASLALRAHGMRTLVAEEGAQALAILQGEPDVSAVVLDVTMPGMSGDEALPLIKAMRPDLPVIISSGFSDAEIHRRFQSSEIAGVITKPYKMPAFVEKIAEVLNCKVATGRVPG